MPPDKLKISYILPDFDENAYSGGLYVIFQHCNGLIEHGHNVRVFNNIGKKSKYLRLDCPVELHKNDPAIVENNSPDIVVGTYWHTLFFINRMKYVVRNKTKLCFLIQDSHNFIHSKEERQLIYKAMATRYAGTIPIHKIVISRYLKDVMERDFGQDVFYVRNGFEPREAAPLLPESEKLRITARYDPSKFRGWDLVDKVLRRVTKERDDIEIHLFEMKDKKPTGYRSCFHKGLTGGALLGLFKSSDIFLSGNRCEGFAYPIIEAMSQGSAVCCTDAGGNREFCTDGETALIAPRDDVEILFQNLLKLLDDRPLRARISRNGIDKAKEFSWKESLDGLNGFLMSLAAEDNKEYAELTEVIEKKVIIGEGRALFLYGKDPFVDYKDWINIEESIKFLEDRRLSVVPVLFVDKHPLKSVEARLSMLVGPEGAVKFKYKVFYIKKLKLRLPILPRVLFTMGNVIELLTKRYAYVIVAKGGSTMLKILCRLLGIRFYHLDFHNGKSEPYRFDSYSNEYSRKEAEYRRLSADMIKSAVET